MSNSMTPEKLVGMYLNKAGRVNAQFTRAMQKVSPEVHVATVALIRERGLKPYECKPPKQRKIKLAPQEQSEKPVKITAALIRELLAEVRKEREGIADRLKTLDIVDRHYIEKLRLMETKDDGDDELDELIKTPDQSDYEKAHESAANNRREIIRSSGCGCFYCGETFAPSEIKKWADGGQTAICPRCDVDSVIGDRSGYNLSKEFLARMYDRWFEGKTCSTDSESGSVGGESQ